MTKRFGALVAVDDAALTVHANSVHALLGENGAGKTTLMRMAFGMIHPDAGDMHVFGKPGWPKSPADAIARGIGMVHQHFTAVPQMTVAENIALGRRGLYRVAAARARVQELSERTGLALDPDAPVGTLPVGAQQRLEILKALARDARVLILDEPTAVLTPVEAEELGRVVRGFADQGGAVVLITHKLREARALADRVTVLRHGHAVLSAAAEEVSERSLADAMIGSATSFESPSSSPGTRGPVVFAARGIALADARGLRRVHDASFDIHGGEIVGLAGVEGSGHHELLRALAGRVEPIAGTLERPTRVGFVPEDRHRDALILDFSLTENVALHDAGEMRGRIVWRDWARQTRGLMDQFDVRAPGIDVPARTLSGGNQQKLVLARELANAPPGLVVENPSRGLDIAATAAVHDRLRRARDDGTAVVMYSSDLDEVLALADRVLVLHGGHLHEVPADRGAVGRAMLGIR
ncbi:MAG TPA: ABC transporter ATP-binding protein [Gemmatimonadaceae bacterium]|nr:ABC transporter ATP-binding protein [Gemmatimonadaceae bacterium]